MALHQLSGSHVDVHLFKYLAMQSRTEASVRLSFQVPSTVVFRVCPVAWYDSEVVRSGTAREVVVRQRSGTQLELNKIFSHFSAPTAQKGVKAGPSTCDVCSWFIGSTPGSKKKPTVRYFTKQDLHQFLFDENVKKNGILQRFVPSRSGYCESIQSVWSPKMAFSVRRLNESRLSNRSVPLHMRANTFDGNLSTCREVICTSSVSRELEGMCSQIVQHLALTDPTLCIRRLVVYFRRDAGGFLWLLYSSSVLLKETVRDTQCGRLRPQDVQSLAPPLSLVPGLSCSLPDTVLPQKKKKNFRKLVNAIQMKPAVAVETDSASLFRRVVGESVVVESGLYLQRMFTCSSLVDDALYRLAVAMTAFSKDASRGHYQSFAFNAADRTVSRETQSAAFEVPSHYADLFAVGNTDGFHSVLESLGFARDVTPAKEAKRLNDDDEERMIRFVVVEGRGSASLADFCNCPCRQVCERVAVGYSDSLAEKWTIRFMSESYNALLGSLRKRKTLTKVVTVVKKMRVAQFLKRRNPRATPTATPTTPSLTPNDTPLHAPLNPTPETTTSPKPTPTSAKEGTSVAPPLASLDTQHTLPDTTANTPEVGRAFASAAPPLSADGALSSCNGQTLPIKETAMGVSISNVHSNKTPSQEEEEEEEEEGAIKAHVSNALGEDPGIVGKASSIVDNAEKREDRLDTHQTLPSEELSMGVSISNVHSTPSSLQNIKTHSNTLGEDPAIFGKSSSIVDNTEEREDRLVHGMRGQVESEMQDRANLGEMAKGEQDNVDTKDGDVHGADLLRGLSVKLDNRNMPGDGKQNEVPPRSVEKGGEGGGMEPPSPTPDSDPAQGQSKTKGETSSEVSPRKSSLFSGPISPTPTFDLRRRRVSKPLVPA